MLHEREKPGKRPKFYFILRKVETNEKPLIFLGFYMKQGVSGVHGKMRLIGIEPTHAAPEATALSTELQTHLRYHTILF